MLNSSEVIKYIIQKEDGKFYWKSPNISSYYNWKDSLNDATLFQTKCNAEKRVNLLRNISINCKVREVIITLK